MDPGRREAVRRFDRAAVGGTTVLRYSSSPEKAVLGTVRLKRTIKVNLIVFGSCMDRTLALRRATSTRILQVLTSRRSWKSTARTLGNNQCRSNR